MHGVNSIRNEELGIKGGELRVKSGGWGVKNISSRQTVSEKPNNHEKIYIFGKKCIISAFFLQLSAKKNNKDYIKTLDTEQNADYTIMDWVY